MEKRDVYFYVKETISPIEVAIKYLGKPDKIRGDSNVYYSPLREKENTPSFFVNKIGMYDFGTSKYYNIIHFVSKLFQISYWEATIKLIEDFNLDINNVSKEPLKKDIITKVDVLPIKLVTGNISKNIICYFDNEQFYEKPKDQSTIAQIKGRITNNNFSIYNNKNEIQTEILRGRTCVPSAIRGNAKENWRAQQIFMVDFDNKENGENLTIDNSQHLTINRFLEYCQKINLLPTFVYTTFSHTEKQHKFRAVYIMEEPIKDMNIAQQTLLYLLKELEELNPDTSKKNLSDMFFGGKSIVYSNNNYYKVKEAK